MAIKNINYSVRLYKLVPATVLQAYQHRIAQTLFGLPKAETKYGQLQVNADGTWRFENLLAKGSNTFNPNNAQTKEKALEFATNWLSQVRSKISEALEKQIFPTDLQNLIPHNYLRLESATPQYKENSQYITHWDIRYDLEYPYYPNLKARGDQQHFTLQVSDRIIGVEAQCRATNGVEGSTLITPAPLQDMEAILQAQIPVITIDENADADELPPLQALPIVYRIVRNRLLPYWITWSGDLVPATREGEMVAKQEDKENAPVRGLMGINTISAERALHIIRNTFYQIENGEQLASLFALEADGRTFKQISMEDLAYAMIDVSYDAQCLAIGYHKLITDEKINVVEVVTHKENITEYGQDLLRRYDNSVVKNGAEADKENSGGITKLAKYDEKLVPSDRTRAYVLMLLKSQEMLGTVNWSDLQKRISSPEEVIAHEFLGHGLGNEFGHSELGLDESVQSTNLYLRAVKKYNLQAPFGEQGYFRVSHGGLQHSDGFDPNIIPWYMDINHFRNYSYKLQMDLQKLRKN